LEENPNEEIVTLGQQDRNSFCECSNCSPQVMKYKESGVMIRFVNKVANAVQAHFDAKGEGRKIQFATYAYQKTQVPPVDDSGKALDSSVYPANNVSIIIAPLSACYIHSINNTDCNAIAKQTFEGWQKLNATIYVRFYSAQYAYYFVPFIQYGNMAKNYEIVDEYGAEYIFDTAIGETMSSGFHDLLAYLKSELMWDHSQNVRGLIDDFMKVYYKDAYEPIKGLFDIIRNQEVLNEKLGKYTFSFGEWLKMDYWPEAFVDKCLKLIDEAYAKIEPLKATDPDLYEELQLRILRESLFPRYLNLSLYPYIYEDFDGTWNDFLIDCHTFGIFYLG
jgi:hypothetical protein